MRLELETLDARGLTIDLPPAHSDVEQKLRITSATGLSGALTQSGGVMRIERAVAEQLVLDVLALVFGSVLLREQGEATFTDARAVIEKDAQHTAIDFEAATVHTTSLGVDVGTVHLRSETRMREMRLWVRDGEGRLEASQVQFAHARLHLGGASISANQLNAERVQLAWGTEGFRLEAHLMAAPKAEIIAGGLKMHAEGLVIHGLHVHGGSVSFSGAEVNTAQLDFTFSGGAREAQVNEPMALAHETPSTAMARPKIFDFSLLDGLSGELNVDAAVDMSVPLIGHRRATHRLRLGIDDGSIDYRELESSLSGLEESLLDFSVRNSALVLELGIPLLPTRGLGKPLVLWDLSPEDLKLTERRRVRLSVLPTYRLAGSERRSEPPRSERRSEPARDPDSSSSFALRSLDLKNIDLRLSLSALPEPLESVLRFLSFASLHLQGAVYHEPQEQGPALEGNLDAQLTGLDLALTGLPLGASVLDLSRLQLAELASLHIDFLGLTPTRLRAELKLLVLSATQLRS